MTTERLRRLETAMADLRPRRVEGAWHRFVAELYKDDAGSDQGALEHGGRYNPRREFGALYLSESPAACHAELQRRPGCVCGTGMRASRSVSPRPRTSDLLGDDETAETEVVAPRAPRAVGPTAHRRIPPRHPALIPKAPKHRWATSRQPSVINLQLLSLA